MVSAVIPTYNYGRFVEKAVRSVLAQTYQPIECIVVDDGSNDDTAQRLQSLPIRLLWQENRGLSAARNRGVAEASGDLIAFLDADDWWQPDKIEKQVAALKPSDAAVGCGIRNWSADGSLLFCERAKSPTERCEQNLRLIATRQLWIGGSGSGALIRRQVLTALGGFDESLRGAEDWDLWLRIAAAYSFSNVDDFLTNLFWHGTGVFRDPPRMEENQWRVYEKAIARWPETLGASVRKQMRALILADAAGEWIATGDRAKALACYASSLRQWPFARKRWRRVASLAVRQIVARLHSE